MKAQIVEGWPKGNKIRIILSETNAAQVNGLRRAILSDVSNEKNRGAGRRNVKQH